MKSSLLYREVCEMSFILCFLTQLFLSETCLPIMAHCFRCIGAALSNFLEISFELMKAPLATLWKEIIKARDSLIPTAGPKSPDHESQQWQTCYDFLKNLFYSSHFSLNHDLICVILWLGSETIFTRLASTESHFLREYFLLFWVHKDFSCVHTTSCLHKACYLITCCIIFNRSMCILSLCCYSGL